MFSSNPNSWFHELGQPLGAMTWSIDAAATAGNAPAALAQAMLASNRRPGPVHNSGGRSRLSHAKTWAWSSGDTTWTDINNLASQTRATIVLTLFAFFSLFAATFGRDAGTV